MTLASVMELKPAFTGSTGLPAGVVNGRESLA